jgi:NADPH:quinone reductase-like Zn-dependent oxidoreductase
MTLPSHMSAMVLTGHGGFDRLVWRDDLPVPRPGPGEVLIRVGAAAVNNTDINTRIGWYSASVRGATDAAGAGASDADGGWSGAPLQFPRIQGADCCGRIVATGADVDPARIGERVLVRPMQADPSSPDPFALATFGSEFDGGFAQFACARADEAFTVESTLSDAELASFPCAWSTAEAMIQRVGLGAERVLITGASGGVGAAAVCLAQRRGATVTALAGGSKTAAVAALGAADVRDRDAPLPEGAFDVVIDLVAGPRWGDLIRALRRGGRYVASGAIAGPIVELDVRRLYLHDLTLFGSTFQPRQVFADLIGYIERGEVAPLVAATYPLRDMVAAQQAFLAKAHVGKICLTVDHD